MGDPGETQTVAHGPTDHATEPEASIPTLSYATPGRTPKARSRDRVYDAFFLGVGASCAVTIWNLDDSWDGHHRDWIVGLGIAQVVIFWLIVFFRGPRPLSQQSKWASSFFCGLLINAVSVVTNFQIFSARPSLLVTNRAVVLLMDFSLYLCPMTILTTIVAVALLPKSPSEVLNSPTTDP